MLGRATQRSPEASPGVPWSAPRPLLQQRHGALGLVGGLRHVAGLARRLRFLHQRLCLGHVRRARTVAAGRSAAAGPRGLDILVLPRRLHVLVLSGRLHVLVPTRGLNILIAARRLYVLVLSRRLHVLVPAGGLDILVLPRRLHVLVPAGGL